MRMRRMHRLIFIDNIDTALKREKANTDVLPAFGQT
jgi:hypothetical protein